jgi:Flp pilus assembly protein TadD
VLARSGRLDEAIAHFEKALRDDPASAEIRGNLRAALASRKAAAEADRGSANKSR